MLALALMPVWSVPRFPSQDGPNHLYGAGLLLRHDDPLVRRFYQLNPNPDPNWLGHGALAGLMRLAMSGGLA